MSVDEAKHAVPELHEPARVGVREELVLDSGSRGCRAQGPHRRRARREHRRDRAGSYRAGSLDARVGRAADHARRARPARDHVGERSDRLEGEARLHQAQLPRRVRAVQAGRRHLRDRARGAARRAREAARRHEGRGRVRGRARAQSACAREFRPASMRVREFVAIDDKAGTVRAIYLNVPPQADAVIEAAWRSPDGSTSSAHGEGVARLGHRLARDAARRARLEPRSRVRQLHAGRAGCSAINPIASTRCRSSVIGQPINDVKKAYKADLTTVGHDLVIALPPTEWERSATRVVLDIAGGRVEELTFSLRVQGAPRRARHAAQSVQAQVGRAEDGRREIGKPVLVFRDEEPASRRWTTRARGLADRDEVTSIRRWSAAVLVTAACGAPAPVTVRPRRRAARARSPRCTCRTTRTW